MKQWVIFKCVIQRNIVIQYLMVLHLITWRQDSKRIGLFQVKMSQQFAPHCGCLVQLKTITYHKLHQYASYHGLTIRFIVRQMPPGRLQTPKKTYGSMSLWSALLPSFTFELGARRKRYAQIDIISSPALLEAIIIIIINKPLTRPERRIQNQVNSTFRVDPAKKWQFNQLGRSSPHPWVF